MTVEEGGTRFAAAPSAAELARQGATFVRVPRALFQDLYALCDAERRGELPEGSQLAEVLGAPIHLYCESRTGPLESSRYPRGWQTPPGPKPPEAFVKLWYHPSVLPADS